MDAVKRVDFPIVPADDSDTSRVYSNFCAIQHSPYDFTLTFCEVLPLSERDLAKAQQAGAVAAPVKARLVIPIQMVPGLIGALDENFRRFQQAMSPPPAAGSPN
jgi:hypothetical protein